MRLTHVTQSFRDRAALVVGWVASDLDAARVESIEADGRQELDGLGDVPLAGGALANPIADLEGAALPVDAMQAAPAEDAPVEIADRDDQVLAGEPHPGRASRECLAVVGALVVIDPGKPSAQVRAILVHRLVERRPVTARQGGEHRAPALEAREEREELGVKAVDGHLSPDDTTPGRCRS